MMTHSREILMQYRCISLYQIVLDLKIVIVQTDCFLRSYLCGSTVTTSLHCFFPSFTLSSSSEEPSPTLMKTSSIVVTDTPKLDIPYSPLLSSKCQYKHTYMGSQGNYIPSNVVNNTWNRDAALLGRMKDNSFPTSITC